MLSLETIPLLRPLGRHELEALRLIAQERTFDAGREIFREGAPGDGVYFVKSGLVEISAGQRGRLIFSRLGPGEIFGEMAVIEHRPRSATASAVEATEVFFLPRGELLTFIERSPGLAFALLQLISHRLREFNRLHVQELVQAESLALVGRFAQAIVHDLKNPLSIISLASEMSEAPGVSPEQRAKAQSRIRKQVERITDMVGDILIFTQGARKEADLPPGDYRAFVLQLVGDLRAEVDLKGVKIHLENEPPPGRLCFDPRRLSRVFYNLVANATDFMPHGGVVTFRFQSKAGQLLTEIEDTGPGIAPEVAGKLFQPFTSHGKAHGTGLGLANCKKIVEDHGGVIAARSEAGRGAVFSFTLPLGQ